MTTHSHPASDEVLAFWFGEHDGLTVDEQRLDMWFKNGSAYDGEIRERFGHVLQRAAAGALDDWAATPHGRLAVVVVLDQFPRHVHRGRAGAFACDAKAREHCLAAIHQGQDTALTPIERSVLYLPLEHAEDLALQEHSVALFRALLQAVPEEASEAFAHKLDYAVAHRKVVQRFGHFPHRNRLLGRPLSDEQRAFLKQPMSSF